MPEEQTTTETVEDAPTPTPEATVPVQAVPEEEPFDKERAMATITKLRGTEREYKEAKKQLAEYQRREKEAADADLSERERLQKLIEQRDAELETERKQTRDLKNAQLVERAAAKLGIIDPDAAGKLLDWRSLDLDDDGTPQDLDAALKALTEARPWLVAQAGKPRTVANPATRETNVPGQRVYTAAELGNTDFYRKNRDDILKAYKENRIRP